MRKHKFISLGSACDVAIQLNILKLRKISFPFDWLWNHYSGLDFVIPAFEDKFESLVNPKNYEIAMHYRFPYKVLVYRNYDKVAHLHSNPLEKITDHEILVERFKRLLLEVNSDSFKHFIYYRTHQEDLLGKRTINLKESFQLTMNEGFNFVNSMLLNYPKINSNFHLLLILQVETQQIEMAEKILKEYQSIIKTEKRGVYISFEVTIIRNDEEQHEIRTWISQFKNILLKQKNVPTHIKLKILVVSFIYTLQRVKLKIEIFAIKTIIKIRSSFTIF